jgi:transcriptional regulator with XRE-family HTH domain
MHSSDTSLFYKALGKLIRRKRDELDLSQSDLASKIFLTRASVANIETGRQKLLAHQLYFIAQALDLTPDGLLAEAAQQQLPVTSSELDVPTHITSAELTDSQKTQLSRFLTSPRKSASTPKE